MKKIACVQTVVDCVNVQSDHFYEFIKDKDTLPEDRAGFLIVLSDLCNFLIEARDKGFNVDNTAYPLDKKVAILGGNA